MCTTDGEKKSCGEGKNKNGGHSTNEFSTISARNRIEQPVNPKLKTVACQRGSITLTGAEDEHWLWNGGTLNSPFSSWNSAITSVAHGLTNPRLGYDLYNTATMYSQYCQTGTTCGAGLNNLNTFMGQQGADTNRLKFPCDAKD